MIEDALSTEAPATETIPDVGKNPSLFRFLEQITDDRSRVDLSVFSFPVHIDDPLVFLRDRGNENEFQYYWEKPQDRFAIAAGQSIRSIRAGNSNRFKSIGDQINQLKKRSREYVTGSCNHSGLFFLGGFAFSDEVDHQQWERFGTGVFTIPGWAIVKDGDQCTLTITLELKNNDTPKRLRNRLNDIIRQFYDVPEVEGTYREVNSGKHPHFSDAAHSNWIKAVDRAKDLIGQEAFKKIVIARQTKVAIDEDPDAIALIDTLRQQYPECYTFLLQQAPGSTFVGSTPERLASFEGNRLLTEALAGSIKRGQDPETDSDLEEELLNSTKNGEEHRFVVDAIENQLRPFARDIRRGRKPVIKKLTNVQHLFTPIEVTLKEHCNWFSLLGALHPTPAVGGYPWPEAKKYLKKLEQFDRGWYAGPIGWVNGGKGEFAVAIRSGLIGRQEACFFAGCGIVADSDPESEWEETNLKLMPMLSAFGHD